MLYNNSKLNNKGNKCMNEDMDLEDKVDNKVKEPSRYNVLLLNDDFTPFDFVIDVLINIFNKSEIEAEQLTFLIHKNEKAIVGEYSRDIAISKYEQVMEYAAINKFTLRAIVSKI